MCAFLLLSIELCSPPQGTDELRGSCTRSGSEVPARGKDLALIGVGGLSLGRVVQASSSSLFLGLAAVAAYPGKEKSVLSYKCPGPCPSPDPRLQALLSQL